MSRYFVTGGSGFLGRELIRALCEAGHAVVVLARSPKSEAAVRALGAEPVKGDLDDVGAMTAGMRGCGVVIHAAAHTEEWDTDEAFWRVNVVGTKNVIEAARAAGVRRLVLISSEAVLADGRPLIRVDETHPYPQKPVRGYPASKGEVERAVLAANGDGLETVVVRPRFIWGRGDTANLVKFARAVRDGRFAWVDHGRHLTSSCHVANVCEGTLLAAERGRPKEIYFLTDGEPVEFRWLLTEILKTQGIPLPSRSVPRRLAWIAAGVAEALWRTFRLSGVPFATRVPLALMGVEVTVNDAKARRELGYAGRMTIAEGLAEMARLPKVVPEGVAGRAA
ncbi:MAG: NAD-dependent epimerase/dehydratase family protein [Myxococcaceae bacterium]|nr:NAD-dependent epimerase/dehydratase family protein [Myxococcaceae bacterium]